MKRSNFFFFGLHFCCYFFVDKVFFMHHESLHIVFLHSFLCLNSFFIFNKTTDNLMCCAFVFLISASVGSWYKIYLREYNSLTGFFACGS